MGGLPGGFPHMHFVESGLHAWATGCCRARAARAAHSPPPNPHRHLPSNQLFGVDGFWGGYADDILPEVYGNPRAGLWKAFMDDQDVSPGREVRTGPPVATASDRRDPRLALPRARLATRDKPRYARRNLRRAATVITATRHYNIIAGYYIAAATAAMCYG